MHANEPTLRRLARETALRREREARRHALLELAPKPAPPWAGAWARLRQLLPVPTRREHEPCAHR